MVLSSLAEGGPGVVGEAVVDGTPILASRIDGVTGLGIYADGMVEHDGHVGQLLDKLDELGINRGHHGHVLHG